MYADDKMDALRENPTRSGLQGTVYIPAPVRGAPPPSALPDTLIQCYFQAAGQRTDTWLIITTELLTGTKLKPARISLSDTFAH